MGRLFAALLATALVADSLAAEPVPHGDPFADALVEGQNNIMKLSLALREWEQDRRPTGSPPAAPFPMYARSGGDAHIFLGDCPDTPWNHATVAHEYAHALFGVRIGEYADSLAQRLIVLENTIMMVDIKWKA
jgi:hypothetical protein